MKALRVKKENTTRYLVVACAAELCVCRAVQTEVYFYAGLLFVGAAILTLWIAALLPVILDGPKPTRGKGVSFLTLCLVASLWMESLTAALVVVFICLLIYHFYHTRKVSGYLIGALCISAVGLLVMHSGRQGALLLGKSSLFDLLGLGTAVLDVVFRDNGAVTAFVSACMAVFFFTRAKTSGNTLKKVILYCGAAFTVYFGLIHAVAAYNTAVVELRSYYPEDVGMSIINTYLPVIELGFLIPSSNEHVRLIAYVLFILAMLYVTAVQKENRQYLTVFGAAMVIIGVPCVVGVYFGCRIITPALLLLLLIFPAVLSEADIKEKEKTIRFDGYVVKGIVLAAAMLLISAADSYYVRFTRVGEKNRYNEHLIRSCVERQLRGEWDFEEDYLNLHSLYKDLYTPDISHGDPHFSYWCRHYGVDERTVVRYFE